MTTALPPEADKARLVASYNGLNIFDVRDMIRVVIAEDAPRGVRACLKAANFKPTAAFTWERPASPAAIFDAQEVAALFYEGAKP